MGRARLKYCFELSMSDFAKDYNHHYVHRLSDMPYKHIYAWVLENAERFDKPSVYDHRQGAVIWVRV